MLQKTKSLLLKLLMLLCVACCAVALAFSLAGCSGVTVDRMEINADGDLIVYYSDGSTANLGNVKGEAEEQVVPVQFDYDPATGLLTITYSDGHTETVPIGDGEDETCEHANMETIKLSAGAWNCAVGGQLLEVCDDCGYAHVVNVPAGHHYVETVVAPTCVKEGYTTQVCEYCGIENSSVERTDITEPTGEHNYSEEGYEVAYPGGTLCEGGWLIHICDGGCGTVEYTDLEATGHTVENWTVNNADPSNADLKATGFCTECGKEVVIELPQLTAENLKDYTYEITEDSEDVNCSDSMKAHFTYVDEKTGTTVEFDGTLPAGNHTLNGKPVIIPDSGVLNYDELPEGMELAGNSGQAPSCSSTGVYAVFTCEVCNRPIVVNVTVPHTKPANATVTNITAEIANQYLENDVTNLREMTAEQVAELKTDLDAALTTASATTPSNVVYHLDAYCGSYGDGFEMYYCSVCKDVVTDTIEADHNVVYSMIELDTNGDGTNDTVIVTNDCSICKNLPAKDRVNVTLTNYTITETPATCDETGTKVVTGYNAESKKTETYTAVIPTTNHRHSEYGTVFDTDGGPYSVLTYPHVTISGNVNVTNCSAGVVYGVFTCEDCGKPIVIEMEYPHTEPAITQQKPVIEVSAESKYSSYVNNPAGLVAAYIDCDGQSGTDDTGSSGTTIHDQVFVQAATCTTAGFRAYWCDVCKEGVYEVVPALEHELVEHVTYNKDTKTYTYEITCANATTGSAHDLSATDEVKLLTAIKNYNGSDKVNSLKFNNSSAENGKVTLSGIPEISSTQKYGIEKVGTTTANCTEDGSATYRIVLPYSDEGAEGVVFTSNIIVQDVSERAAHTLNGKLMPLKNDDGTDVYYDPAKFPGITPSGNEPLTCAGKGGLGVFTCDVCGQPIVVHIRNSHTAPATTNTTAIPDWSAIKSAFGVSNDKAVEVVKTQEEVNSVVSSLATNVRYSTAASCEAIGQYLYKCTVCGNWVYGQTAKTGHSFAFSSVEWVPGDKLSNTSHFAVTFKCTNAGCDTDAAEKGAQAKEIVLNLAPFIVNDDNGNVSVKTGWTVEDFMQPTHNSQGYFTVSYKITAKDFTAANIAGEDDDEIGKTIAKNFSYELTASGRLGSDLAADGSHYHLFFDHTEDPEGEQVFYWWDETTDAETSVVTRTYYKGYICKDCGEIWAVVQVANGLTNGSVSGDKIPDSDLPIYEDAVKADQAAEQNPAA